MTGQTCSSKADKTPAKPQAAASLSHTTSHKCRKGTSTATSDPNLLGDAPPIMNDEDKPKE